MPTTNVINVHMAKYKLKSFYPNFFNNRAISYACLSIAEHMASDAFETSVMGIASTKDARKVFYKDAIPPFLKRIAYKFLSSDTLRCIAEYRFKKNVNKGDIVYLWPGSSVGLFRSLKEKGCLIIRENINTHTGYAKEILEKEGLSLGINDVHSISSEMINEEIEIQKYTDYVFSPSPEVSQSLIKYGVPHDSIMTASYGLKHDEILSSKEFAGNEGQVTAIFVGRICVRKGIHLLLSAWKEANINGRLILVGAIDTNVEQFVRKHLSENIEHIPYTNDLKSIYRNADLFILPSIEEGSPLVTYLALGAGIPSIVSPMGGGGIISADEGVVIEPHDKTAWVDAIQKLSFDGELRKKMGANAHEKAKEYTWEQVGRRRMKELEKKLQSLKS